MKILIVIIVFLFGIISFLSCSKDKVCNCRYLRTLDGVVILDSTSLYPGNNSNISSVGENDEEVACNFYDANTTVVDSVAGTTTVYSVECELE